MGAVFPSASERAMRTSITLPFSACMQMSAPFLAVRESALKMVASSTMRRVLRSEVHDIDGHAGDFRHGDGAVHGFRFGARRARERVVNGRGLSVGERACDEDIDHAAVFD